MLLNISLYSTFFGIFLIYHWQKEMNYQNIFQSGIEVYLHFFSWIISIIEKVGGDSL